MMRKRLLACIIAAAMALEAVPVSASEISHEEETVEVSSEVSEEEASIEEISIEETSIEETSMKETLTESGATDTTAPEEEKAEEGSKEDETQSVEEGQETQTDTEADSAEPAASETESTVETGTDSENETTEIESASEEPLSETEIESTSEEPLSETDYEEYPNGVIPFEIDGTDIFAGLNTSFYATRGIENRAKYDPRIDAPEEMTPVRNQGRWGTCWAHAVMTCLENAAIRQGLADNSIDLSERHLAYFVGNTGFDKLGNANDDTIVSNPEDGWANVGGHTHWAATKLMNWHGAASEEKYPYSYSDTYDAMVVSQSGAQDIEVMAHDLYFIPTSEATKDEKVTAIKKLIAEYGCVWWSYGCDGEYYNDDTFAHYNPNTYANSKNHHAITVVGWDDDFPVNNFGNSNETPVYRPQNKGAWIVKNSWGDVWGDSGYFYISYEDVSLGTGNVASVMVVADKKEYDNNYFYGNTTSLSRYSAKKAAQVYQVKSGVNTEKLTAVSVLLGSDKVEYSLQVYKNPKLVDGIVKDPESGTAMLKEPVTGTTGYEGLYTIDLPEPVTFSKGDWMSIVFTFADSAYIYADAGGTYTHTDEVFGTYTREETNTTHAGQSFRNTGSTWRDAHDSNYNFRINALTEDYIYRVTFLDAWGNPISEQMVDGGKDAVPPTAPDREGYTFKGWSGSYQNITKNTKLTAEYEPITYSITYELNGGTIETENPSSYTIETETIVLAEPIREWHFFAGWYEQSDFSGAPIGSIQKGSVGNKTLYAKWEEDTAELAKPALIPQGGIVEEGQTVVIKAPKGADIYYTLDGTTPTAKDGIKYTDPFTITRDVTIKAVAVRNGESSEVAEVSCQYYALRLVLAEDVTDLWKYRSKKLELSQIPATKSEADVTWTTSDKKVVTVSEDGTITGVAVGTATITAKTRNGKGDEVTAGCQVTVKETDDIATGSHQGIVWYIDSAGKLVVMGKRDFSDAIGYGSVPWYAYREKILSAEIKVTDITHTAYMFYECSNLTEVDISGLKTDKVTDMSYMFYGCHSLTEVDVSGLKTDKVTNMRSMFSGCRSLTEVDVSGFKTDQVTDVSFMFNGCNELTDLNLSSFDLGNVTGTINNMLPNSSKLKIIYTPHNLKQGVSLPSKGSNYAWYKPNGTIITELPQNLSESILITQKVRGNYNNITWEIDENGKLTIAGTGEFSAYGGNTRAPWYNYQYLPDIQSAEVNVTGMTNASYMFYGCSNLKEVDVSGLRTDQVTDVSGMFYGCDGLTDLNLSSFDLGNVTGTINNMLPNSSKLETIQTPRNLKQSVPLTAKENYAWCKPDGTTITELPQNLSESILITQKLSVGGNYQDITWEIDEDGKLTVTGTGDFSVGTSYNRAPWFKYREEILSAEIKVTDITNTASMFYGCSNLTEVDISGLKTDQVTDMHFMFHGCSSLTEVDASGLKTDQVTDMSGMFYNCSSLTEVDASGLKTDQVTDMSFMFYHCSSLTKVEISGLKTDQVTDMSCMFDGCSSLTKVEISGLKTDQVTDMHSMFRGCSSLTEVDVSGLKTDQVTDMSYMFYGCSSLTNLDVSSFRTEQATDIDCMFDGCDELTDLNLGSFDLGNVTEDLYYMLPSSSKLQTIQTPRNLKKSVLLTAKTNYAWCKPDGTIITELPQNLSESILITQKWSVGGTYQGIAWEIDEDGKLTVTGTGDFSAGTGYDRAPWYAYRKEILSAGIKVTDITNTAYMFNGCSNLTKVDLGGLKTDSVTDMRSMFYGCSSLTDVDVSGFQTDQVTNISYMFYGCNELTDLNLSSFDFSNVTETVNNVIPYSAKLETIQASRNLKRSIGLPASDDKGWYQEDGTLIIELPQNLDHSILLTKKTKKVYKITFDLQGHGTEIAAIEVYEGNKISEPPKPEAEDYDFTGWYKEADCQTLWDFGSDTVEADTTLYAGWEQITTEPGETVYKVTFDLQGHGAEIEEIEVKEGDKISEPPRPEAEGYSFTGWYKETVCQTLWDFESDTVEADTILYAGWEEIKPEPKPEETVYKITFDLKGHGTQIAPIEVKKGDKISEPPKPEAEGYSFMGWYKEAGCRTLWDFEKDTVNKNTTLYAGWKKTGDSENPYEPPAVIPDGIWIAPIRDYTYTGRAITPVVHVYYNKQKLILGRDYTITYRNNTKAAGAWEKKAPQVCVKGRGNYSGTAKREFTIEKAHLTDENLKAAGIYGENIKYTPVVALDGNPLKAGTDYTLIYLDAYGMILKKQPTTIGNYQMRIIGKGNCEGQIDFSYRIAEQGGADAIDKGTAIVGDMTYDGAEPQVTLTVGGRTLEHNTDYVVSFINTNKKGTATAIFFGIGNYAGTLKKNFKVQAAPIQQKDVRIDENVMYEKGGAKPTLSVTVNEAELVAGTDYTVTYKNNTKIGYAEVTVKGKGNYAGVLTKAFQVEPKSLTAEGVKIYVSDAAFGKKPTVMVYDSNGKTLSANSDYSVFIDRAGQNVRIMGGKNGLYKAQETIAIPYHELEKDRLVSSVTLNKKAGGFPKYFEYTGGEVTLEKDWLTVKAGKTVLGNDEFEIISYVNNIEKGTASVIIQGTNGYGGIKVLKFNIKAKGFF